MRDQNFDLVKTQVDGVYVGFCTKAWASGEASYLFPMEKGLNDKEGGGNLAREWKYVLGFLPRRDTTIDDGTTSMKAKRGSKWDWKAFVVLIDEEETSVEKAGRHIANCFTKFTRNKDVMDSPEKYTFRQCFSDNPRALNHYLLDMDVVKVMKSLVSQGEGEENVSKEDLLEDESNMAAFFGSIAAGREYLEGIEDDDWSDLVDIM